jgi:hypothetical protein
MKRAGISHDLGRFAGRSFTRSRGCRRQDCTTGVTNFPVLVNVLHFRQNGTSDQRSSHGEPLYRDVHIQISDTTFRPVSNFLRPQLRDGSCVSPRARKPRGFLVFLHDLGYTPDTYVNSLLYLPVLSNPFHRSPLLHFPSQTLSAFS